MSKMIKLEVDGLTGEISEDLVNDLKVIHGIDAIAELTTAMKQTAKEERIKGNRKNE